MHCRKRKVPIRQHGTLKLHRRRCAGARVCARVRVSCVHMCVPIGTSVTHIGAVAVAVAVAVVVAVVVAVWWGLQALMIDASRTAQTNVSLRSGLPRCARCSRSCATESRGVTPIPPAHKITS